MNKLISFSVALLSFSLLAGCQSTAPVVIPLRASLEQTEAYTIIWNGISKAYRYENGQWVRAEEYDYQFDVIQQRETNHWKSVKSLHRLHPDYDGKAGPRDQAMYFEVRYQQLTGGVVQSTIESSLGGGTGTSDEEFREAVLTMYVPNPSRWMPYNKLRISQKYDYEGGILTETVELIDEQNGQETPFMKNEEIAHIFVKSRLEKAPTTFQR